jgi:hypothetical protein
VEPLRRYDRSFEPIVGKSDPVDKGPKGFRSVPAQAVGRRIEPIVEEMRYPVIAPAKVSLLRGISNSCQLDRTLKTMPNGLGNVDQYCHLLPRLCCD